MKDIDLAARLKAEGHKVTPQRAAVFEVLRMSRGKPMTPEEIYRACQQSDSGVGLTTVYRSLELFCEVGIALEAHLHEASAYYELNDGGHHHHLICVGCGTVEPFETCVVDKMTDQIRQNHDFVVSSHCLSLFGRCPSCLADD